MARRGLLMASLCVHVKSHATTQPRHDGSSGTPSGRFLYHFIAGLVASVSAPHVGAGECLVTGAPNCRQAEIRKQSSDISRPKFDEAVHSASHLNQCI